jgi:tetratricopeptide (TPR) repeat protein
MWAKSLTAVDPNQIITWQNHTTAILGEQFSRINDSKKFLKLIKTEGVARAKKFYEDFKKQNPDEILFSEMTLNTIAYQYLANQKIDDALELFALNIKEYPQSWNAWDSFGEAWLNKGDRQQALVCYQKSVDLNPDNVNGKKIIESLMK